jgi:hypothetical protein
VTGKVIHDDDIAMAQGRGEKVLDIGQETRSVHRTVKDTGCGDLIVAKRGNECCRHPMAMRHRRDEPLPTQSTPIEPRHIGLRPSFINEDKFFRIQIGLTRTPFFAGFGDIRAALFGGPQ